MEACRVAEALLHRLWKKPDRFPRDRSGPVPGHGGWTWRTTTVPSEDAEAIGAEVVAVEVFAPNRQSEPPAARVELLLPTREDEITKGTDAR